MLKTCFTLTLVSIGLLVTSSHAAPLMIGSNTTNGWLVQIDPTTGVVTPIGPFGRAITSLTYDPIHQMVYGSSAGTHSSELVRIDPATGATTVVSDLGLPLMHAIEYVPDKDTLFGGANSSFYTINAVTGAATFIGHTGFRDLAVGMAFDSTNGILYATDGGPLGSTGLFSIDLSTGASTLVASFHQPDGFFFQITGLAFDPVVSFRQLTGHLRYNTLSSGAIFFSSRDFCTEVKARCSVWDLWRGQPGHRSPHSHDSVYLTFRRAEQPASGLGRCRWRGDRASLPDLSARVDHRTWAPAQAGA